MGLIITMTIDDATNGKMDIGQLEMAGNDSATPNSKPEEGLTNYFDPVLDKKTLLSNPSILF